MPRLVFLSTAHIHTKSFIENVLKAGDGRRVAAVWDDVPERGRRYAEMAGAPFEADLATVLAREDADGFVICAENTRHLPLLRAALPVGKPVFCEKPLVTNVAELAEVEALLAAHPASLFCGYFQPFGADLQSVARRLEEGAFGPVTQVRLRNAHHAAYGRWFDNPDLAWFTDPALAGGGAFMDMGTHAIHALISLFGEVTEVWAEVRNVSGVYPKCDDMGVAHLRFASGVSGTVEAGWTHTGAGNGLEVVGARAALWPTPQGYVMGAPKTAAVALTLDAPARPTRMDRLVAAIKGELTPVELAADLVATRAAVRVMSAAYAAAASGRWERV